MGRVESAIYPYKGTEIAFGAFTRFTFKMESKWCKVFLSKEQKTYEETIDYIRCMTLTQNVDPLVYQCITNSHIDAVNAYIEAPMTASTVKEEKDDSINRQQITSELIYYWMTAYHIPFECQKWHLNRFRNRPGRCRAPTRARGTPLRPPPPGRA